MMTRKTLALAVCGLILAGCNAGSASPAGTPAPEPTEFAVGTMIAPMESADACAGSGGQIAFRHPVLEKSDELRVIDVKSGKETVVASRVGRKAIGWQAWSKDGALAYLAYDAEHPNVPMVHVRQADGTDKAFVPAMAVTWSPDGKRLLASVQRENGIGFVPAVVKVDDATMTRFVLEGTSNESDVRTLAWSPDGSRFAVTVYDSQAPSGQRDWLYLFDVAQGSQSRVQNPPNSGNESLSWSPDGTRLLVSSRGGWVYDVSNGSFAPTGGLAAFWGQWSAKDQWVLAGVPAPYEIVVVSDAEGKPLWSIPVGVVEGEGPAGDVWSPDGNCVALSSDKGVSLWEPSTGKVRLLTKTTGGAEIAWSR